MGDQDDGEALEARPPTIADLVTLCRELNRQAAKYVVIGGMAVIQAGFVRATEDIDLLVEASAENFEKVRKALLVLPDQAVREVAPGDLDSYVVIRVADEIVVDLMKAACGVDYAGAEDSIEWVTVDGVQIPFANAELLWRTKQTVREKDNLDKAFLKELLSRRT